MNKIFIIVGPSGAGKDTLLNMLYAKYSKLLYLPSSYTTRKQRTAEKNKRKYLFTDKKNFQKLLRSGEIIEYVLEHGNYYGTSRKSLLKGLKSGRKIVTAIDARGAEKVKKLFPKITKSVYISGGDLEELRRRLLNDPSRKNLTVKELNIRLKNAAKEMKYKEKADFIIENKRSKQLQAFEKLKSVILAD